MKIPAILFDLGDTIMLEETEIKDAERNTLKADLVDGMGDALHALHALGYRLGLVADTRFKTAWNVLHQHALYDLFDAFAVSEEVGAEKPDPLIFVAALDALGIPRVAYNRVIMVGNNAARDVRGANKLGLIPVLFHWNDRYPAGPGSEDRPAFEISRAQELLTLVHQLEQAPE